MRRFDSSRGHWAFRWRHAGYAVRMTQYEQENDLGRGGGEVDDEMMRRAWEQSIDDTPNRAPEFERPTDPPIPGADAVDEPQ